MEKPDYRKKVEKYFRDDAYNKRDFYKSKCYNQIKTDINKRRMWKIYTKNLNQLMMSNSNNDNVCDLGCGMGNFIFEMIEKNCFKKIIGVDNICETQKIAIQNKRFFKDADFIQADLKKLPFKNNYFDMVFCLNVLHHFKKNHFEESLKEFSRISNKFIIIEIRNEKFLFDFLYSKILIPNYYHNLPIFLHEISEVTKFMNKIDFNIYSIKCTNYFRLFSRRILLIYKKNKEKDSCS